MKARQLDLFPKPPRTYVVSVYGWGDAHFTALTAGKARYAAYRALCEAAGARNFHWFLINSRVSQARSPEERSAA
jgi:hypothetical protein